MNVGTLPLVDSPFPASGGWTPAWYTAPQMEAFVLQSANKNAIPLLSGSDQRSRKGFWRRTEKGSRGV